MPLNKVFYISKDLPFLFNRFRYDFVIYFTWISFKAVFIAMKLVLIISFFHLEIKSISSLLFFIYFIIVFLMNFFILIAFKLMFLV